MKYLSKLLSMLLIGCMLYTTACTDYDEDIRDLNQKVDDLGGYVDALYSDEITPLKGDLQKTKEDLENLRTQLEEALLALEEKHDEDIAALKALLEQKIAAAEQKILDLEGALAQEVAARESAIATLTQQLNDAKSELAEALADETAARESGDKALADSIANEVEALENTIAALETKLQDEIDALETTLKGEIEGLRGEMNDAINEVNDAIDEANEAIKELGIKIDDESKLREERDAELQENINAVNDALATAKAELEKRDAELQAAIEAEAEAREKGDAELAEICKELRAAIEAEVEARKKAITALENELAEMRNLYDMKHAMFEQEISALKRGLERAQADANARMDAIEANVAAIQAELQKQITENASNIANNAAYIRNLQDQIAGLKNSVGSLESAIASTTAQLMNFMGEYAQFAATVNGRLAALEAKDAQLEASVAEIEELLSSLAIQVEINKDLATQNAADIAQNAADIAALQKAAADTYQIMMDADKALWTAINALSERTDAEFEAVRNEAVKAQENLRNEISQAFAALQSQINTIQSSYMSADAAILAQLEEMTKAHDAMSARLADEIKAREAADKAISDELKVFKNEYEEKVRGLEAKLAEHLKRISQLEEDLIALSQKMDQLIRDAIAESVRMSNEYTDNKVGELAVKVDENSEAIKKLQDETARLDKKIDDTKAALEKTIGELQTAIYLDINSLQQQIDKINENLRNMVQSIVFVPEYSDGEATINYATFGNNLIEGRSTLEYQVYPAACAVAITKEHLQYEVKGVQTRSGESLTIADVKGDDNGRLFVTVVARLGQEFYNGQQKDYAASLILETETANLSTEFVGLYPAKQADGNITMRIMYNGEDVTGNENVYTAELEYANIEANPDHIAMQGYYLVFDYDNQTFTKAELAEYGYEVNPVCGDRPILPHPTSTTSPKLNAETGYSEFWLDITKVDASTVGNVFTWTYDYYYNDADKKDKTKGVFAGCSLVITPEKAEAGIGAFEAEWLYSLDAKVDAENNGAYSRTFEVSDIIEVEGYELPSDKSWTEIVADKDYKPTITITDDQGNVVDGINVAIYTKEGKIYVDFQNFAWNATYNVEAVYNFNYIEATMNFTVTTVDRSREPIVINLDPASVMFEANLQLTDDISDDLNVVYDTLVFGNEKNYDIACDEWLLENFTMFDSVDALVVDENAFTGVANDTLLAIDSVNGGKVVYTAYCYADFDFVPAQIEYTKTITTWYGQVVVLNKVLNFEFPVYDFVHNGNYVYGADNNYFSQVQPEYTWYGDDESKGLSMFDVAAVKLPAAFDVVNGEGKKLTAEEMAALSLAYNFEIEDAEHEGITIDPATMYLSYYGGLPSVNVKGNIVINNDNGTSYVVPTSFDEGGKYASYNVRKFNPIGTARVIENPTIPVDNSTVYNVDILNYIELKDYRNAGRQNYDLIANGAWVVGDGTNGFAQGHPVGADYIYRISETWDNDLSKVEESIRPFISMSNGCLTFDNTQQLQLTAPFKVPVTLTFVNCWMETPQTVTVEVTFDPIK